MADVQPTDPVQPADPAPSQDDAGTEQPTEQVETGKEDQDTANAPSGTDPVEENGPANEPEGTDPEAVKVETDVTVEK